MFSFLLSLYQVELLAHVETLFNILWNCQTVFLSSCIILHSHQQCMRVPISPHPCQHLLVSDSLILAILVGMRDISLWF